LRRKLARRSDTVTLENSELLFAVWMVPAAYLLGSIPAAVWTGKIFHGIDVREHGSGNAGATNVMRVLGVRTGVPVLLFDIFKGWAAVSLITLQKSIPQNGDVAMIMSIILGICAVTGHVFPLFAGFRGGKGVATIAGVCIGLHPLATICALATFILVLLIWKFVSLGSIVAGLSFPVWVIFVFDSPFRSLWIFSLLAAVLLLITHRKNIRRLLRGEEGKAGFLFRNRKPD